MVVLITGSNKGIGFEIVRRFAENNYNECIILTARNEKNGLEALNKIKNAFPQAKIEFYKLDINENDAGLKTANYIKQKHGQLSILINNAAIAYPVFSTAPTSEQSKVTCQTNYFATKEFILQMLVNGAIATGGRVLICASVVSDMAIVKCQEDVQNLVRGSFDNINDIDNMANDFIKLAQTNDHESKYANSSYAMSKIFIRAFCEILTKNYKNYKFYSYCPGWCQSDMGGWEKPLRTAAQGSKIAYWLSVGDDEIILKNNGKFFRDDDKCLEWGVPVKF